MVEETGVGTKTAASSDKAIATPPPTTVVPSASPSNTVGVSSVPDLQVSSSVPLSSQSRPLGTTSLSLLPSTIVPPGPSPSISSYSPLSTQHSYSPSHTPHAYTNNITKITIAVGVSCGTLVILTGLTIWACVHRKNKENLESTLYGLGTKSELETSMGVQRFEIGGIEVNIELETPSNRVELPEEGVILSEMEG